MLKYIPNKRKEKAMKIAKIFKKQLSSHTIVTTMYLLLSIMLVVPSFYYFIKNKTVYYFTQVFTYTFMKAETVWENYLNAIIYLLLFFLLFFCYFYFLKNRENIFQTKKKLFTFILLIGILFSIIIPTTSLDVYSYIGNGWVDSHYNENPYYTSVQDITNQYGKDQMLGKVARCWRDEPVVYGPVWSFICKCFTSFSFGNLNRSFAHF